jgi:hypothetical protein
MKSSFHSIISFLLLFCNCQLSSMSWQAGFSKLYSTRLYAAPASLGTSFYNHFARTTQKTQPLYGWEGVFTAPLHSNESYSIVACIFVAVVMCLPSHCVAMNVYSDFVIPAFGSHVTVFIKIHKNSKRIFC